LLQPRPRRSASVRLGSLVSGQLIVIAPTSSACSGDSGSGFITAGGGKNFVTGIAALTSDLDCNRPGAELVVTEVWAYLDWIASTTGLHPAPALPTSRCAVALCWPERPDQPRPARDLVERRQRDRTDVSGSGGR